MVDDSGRVENFHNGSELACELKIRRSLALEFDSFPAPALILVSVDFSRVTDNPKAEPSVRNPCLPVAVTSVGSTLVFCVIRSVAKPAIGVPAQPEGRFRKP